MTQANPTISQQFIETLRRNPDIFNQHPELLELINLSDSRSTSSLLERQVEQLKQRIASMRHQKSEMIDVARENEAISDNFTEVICQLIAYQNLSEFAADFPRTLKRIFEIDEVAIKTSAAVEKHPSEANAYQETLKRLSHSQALCDNRWPQTVLHLFFSDNIQSAALVPLSADNSSKIIGVLALGSSSPDRYSHELGTAHLNRLGLMAGICLDRLQIKHA